MIGGLTGFLESCRFKNESVLILKLFNLMQSLSLKQLSSSPQRTAIQLLNKTKIRSLNSKIADK